MVIFMTIDKEKISLIQFDLDNEKSEYELKSIKLTMDGNKEEASYFSIIVEAYKSMSNMLDETYNKDLDEFLSNLNNKYLEVRNELITQFHDFDNVEDGFIAGYKTEYLDKLYNEVNRKISRYA